MVFIASTISRVWPALTVSPTFTNGVGAGLRLTGRRCRPSATSPRRRRGRPERAAASAAGAAAAGGGRIGRERAAGAWTYVVAGGGDGQFAATRIFRPACSTSISDRPVSLRMSASLRTRRASIDGSRPDRRGLGIGHGSLPCCLLEPGSPASSRRSGRRRPRSPVHSSPRRSRRRPRSPRAKRRCGGGNLHAPPGWTGDTR